jgi:hypothetical protein
VGGGPAVFDVAGDDGGASEKRDRRAVGGGRSGGGGVMNYKQRLFDEIQNAAAAKLYNCRRGTNNEKEKQYLKECLGYLSLLNYSKMNAKEIYRLWEKSGLAYQ